MVTRITRHLRSYSAQEFKSTPTGWTVNDRRLSCRSGVRCRQRGESRRQNTWHKCTGGAVHRLISARKGESRSCEIKCEDGCYVVRFHNIEAAKVPTSPAVVPRRARSVTRRYCRQTRAPIITCTAILPGCDNQSNDTPRGPVRRGREDNCSEVSTATFFCHTSKTRRG